MKQGWLYKEYMHKEPHSYIFPTTQCCLHLPHDSKFITSIVLLQKGVVHTYIRSGVHCPAHLVNHTDCSWSVIEGRETGACGRLSGMCSCFPGTGVIYVVADETERLLEEGN